MTDVSPHGIWLSQSNSDSGRLAPTCQVIFSFIDDATISKIVHLTGEWANKLCKGYPNICVEDTETKVINLLWNPTYIPGIFTYGSLFCTGLCHCSPIIHNIVNDFVRLPYVYVGVTYMSTLYIIRHGCQKLIRVANIYAVVSVYVDVGTTCHVIINHHNMQLIVA